MENLIICGFIHSGDTVFIYLVSIDYSTLIGALPKFSRLPPGQNSPELDLFYHRYFVHNVMLFLFIKFSIFDIYYLLLLLICSENLFIFLVYVILFYFICSILFPLFELFIYFLFHF